MFGNPRRKEGATFVKRERRSFYAVVTFAQDLTPFGWKASDPNEVWDTITADS